MEPSPSEETPRKRKGQTTITDFYSPSPSKQPKNESVTPAETVTDSPKPNSRKKKTPSRQSPKKALFNKTAKETSPKKTAKKPFFDEKSAVSAAKHKVLVNYLGAWLPMLCNNSRRTQRRYSLQRPQYSRIVYVDGFSGPGIYANGNLGSPALAYKLALDHIRLTDKIPPICLIFVEKEKQICADLLQNLLNLKKENKDAKNASKVTFMVINGRFAPVMEWIISEKFIFQADETVHPADLEFKAAVNSAEKFITRDTPLFVFIDPFGYKGEEMPMTLMKDIMNTTSKGELFVNLITGFLRRRLRLDSSARQINLLTGDSVEDSEWKPIVLNEEDSKKKLERFLWFYNGKLVEGCGGTLHNCMFQMLNKQNSLLYHLYFVTRHPKGFRRMKSAMGTASHKSTEFKFSAFEAGKPDFERTPISIEELTEFIIWRFEGQKVKGHQITTFLEADPIIIQRFRKQLKKSLSDYCVKESLKFDGMQYFFPVPKQKDETEMVKVLGFETEMTS